MCQRALGEAPDKVSDEAAEAQAQTEKKDYVDNSPEHRKILLTLALGMWQALKIDTPLKGFLAGGPLSPEVPPSGDKTGLTTQDGAQAFWAAQEQVQDEAKKAAKAKAEAADAAAKEAIEKFGPDSAEAIQAKAKVEAQKIAAGNVGKTMSQAEEQAKKEEEFLKSMEATAPKDDPKLLAAKSKEKAAKAFLKKKKQEMGSAPTMAPVPKCPPGGCKSMAIANPVAMLLKPTTKGDGKGETQAAAMKPIEAGGQVEALSATVARKQLEMQEARRLYKSELHRKRFTWESDVTSRAKTAVAKQLASERNQTIQLYRDELRKELDLNATQIQQKVNEHLAEEGFAPTGFKGECEALKWRTVYSNVNVTSISMDEATGYLDKMMAEKIVPVFVLAWKPLVRYQMDQELQDECMENAKEAVNVKLQNMKQALDGAKDGAKASEDKMAAVLGKDDSIQPKIDAKVKEVQDYVNIHGSAQLKQSMTAAVDADKAAREGGIAQAAVAQKALDDVIATAANSFSDDEGATKMTTLRLEIKALRNPPKEPAPGEFPDNN